MLPGFLTAFQMSALRIVYADPVSTRKEIEWSLFTMNLAWHGDVGEMEKIVTGDVGGGGCGSVTGICDEGFGDDTCPDGMTDCDGGAHV